MQCSLTKLLLMPLWLGMLVFLAGGCCKDCLKRMDVRVTLDHSLRDDRGELPTVLVQLVGVSDPDKRMLEEYAMSRYWQPGDPMQASALKVNLDFSSGFVQTLSAEDPIWGTWEAQGVKHLFVMLWLPGAHTDRPGSQDAWRRVLPITNRYWDGSMKMLQIQVVPSGLQVMQSPKS